MECSDLFVKMVIKELTEYDITAEPLCTQSKKLYILFSPEGLDKIKSKILNAVTS